MSELSSTQTETARRSWQTPVTLLILMSVAMPVAFNAWSALLNLLKGTEMIEPSVFFSRATSSRKDNSAA